MSGLPVSNEYVECRTLANCPRCRYPVLVKAISGEFEAAITCLCPKPGIVLKETTKPQPGPEHIVPAITPQQ